MRQKGITSDDNVATWHHYSRQQQTETLEESVKLLAILIIHYGETRQRRALMAIEGRRDAPDASLAGVQLDLLFDRIFVQTVRRVRNASMDRGVRLRGEP